MNSKYNIGDSVLIPGKIIGIGESRGSLVYKIDTPYEIPENAVILDRSGIAAANMEAYLQLRNNLIGY